MLVASHGVVEVLQGRLAFVFSGVAPSVVKAHDDPAHLAEDEQAVAVAHAAGVFHGGDIQPGVVPGLDAPIMFRVTLFQGLFIVAKSALRHAVRGAPCKA